MPVTQRLTLLQVAMFDLLPELIELLDSLFKAPSSDGESAHNHTLIMEEHLRSMRNHFKSSGLGLMWLGVVRTHCTSPSAQAVALHEMASRAIKLELRRAMRSTKVIRHKESDGSDIAQTPKEDCVLVQNAVNSILVNWRSFCRKSLILLMTAKFPGCLHMFELNDLDLVFSCINPMLCTERAAKLLNVTLDMAAFHKFSRGFPSGRDIFTAELHEAAESLADHVANAMKSAASSFTKIVTSVDQQLTAWSDDIVVSSTVILRTHCPAALCQAVSMLFQTRLLVLGAAGLMNHSSRDSIKVDSMNDSDECHAEQNVCSDAFACAFQPEHLSAGSNHLNLKRAPIMRIFSQMSPTLRKHAVLQFKKMTAALQSVNIELLNNNSSCVLIMIECLLALSDVANGSSKCFFLVSALDWMESLWKAQEVTSIRAIRSLKNRVSTISQVSILKKLRSAHPSSSSSSSSIAAATSPPAQAAGDVEDSASTSAQNLKKDRSHAKIVASEMAKAKERTIQSIQDHDRAYKRVHDKIYHASVFVSYMCSCSASVVISKRKSRWDNVVAGFELAYRQFMAFVNEGLFSAAEVKRVLWHTLTLVKPLANEYIVLQSCRNPLAPLLLEAFDIFARFAVALDGVASTHFDHHFESNFQSVFNPQMRHIIYVLSLNQNLLSLVFPNCPSVSEATFLLTEGSYYQLLHGEMKTLAQELQDTVEKLEGPSVVKALTLLARGKKYSDPQQRRDEEAMKVVVSRLGQYSLSDDFLCIARDDSAKRGDNSVAILIIGLMLQSNMRLLDITLTDNRVEAADATKGSDCINLQHMSISRDALHCLCSLLQGQPITSVNCCNATLRGDLPPSFAELLKNVSRLDLQGVKFHDAADDFILRKILSNATSASHVNLTYTYGVGDEELCALAFAAGTRLTSLQICHNNSITDRGLCFLATRCSSLQHLHVLGCDNVAGQYISFVAAYCPFLASLDVNFSSIQHKFTSLLPQITGNHALRLDEADIDLIVKLGALPSFEEVDHYLQHHHVPDSVKSQSVQHSKISAGRMRAKLNSVVALGKFAPAQTHSETADTLSKSAPFDPNAVVKVSVAEANRVFGSLERVNEKALSCIEQWISLLYGPGETNRAWLGRAEFAPNMMSKYDAATDDYLEINEDDPEFEVQFNDMLEDFTRRGLDSEQCVHEVKAVLLKKRIEQKENVMAERRLVAEMERDRRTLTTKSECVSPRTCLSRTCSLISIADTKRFITCQGALLKTKMLFGAYNSRPTLQLGGSCSRTGIVLPGALAT